MITILCSCKQTFGSFNRFWLVFGVSHMKLAYQNPCAIYFNGSTLHEITQDSHLRTGSKGIYKAEITVHCYRLVCLTSRSKRVGWICTFWSYLVLLDENTLFDCALKLIDTPKRLFKGSARCYNYIFEPWQWHSMFSSNNFTPSSILSLLSVTPL